MPVHCRAAMDIDPSVNEKLWLAETQGWPNRGRDMAVVGGTSSNRRARPSPWSKATLPDRRRYYRLRYCRPSSCRSSLNCHSATSPEDGAEAAVVKLQDTGPLIASPAVSFAPLTVTVYVVAYANAAVGVKVSVFVVLLYARLPATAVPALLLSVTAIVVDCTALIERRANGGCHRPPVAPDRVPLW